MYTPCYFLHQTQQAEILQMLHRLNLCIVHGTAHQPVYKYHRVLQMQLSCTIAFCKDVMQFCNSGSIGQADNSEDKNRI